MKGMKIRNEYLDHYQGHYDRIPKAVLGAVLASLLSTGGERPEDVMPAVLEEWKTLHQNGIIPQKPPRIAVEDTREAEDPWGNEYR